MIGNRHVLNTITILAKWTVTILILGSFFVIWSEKPYNDAVYPSFPKKSKNMYKLIPHMKKDYVLYMSYKFNRIQGSIHSNSPSVSGIGTLMGSYLYIF